MNTLTLNWFACLSKLPLCRNDTSRRKIFIIVAADLYWLSEIANKPINQQEEYIQERRKMIMMMKALGIYWSIRHLLFAKNFKTTRRLRKFQDGEIKTQSCHEHSWTSSVWNPVLMPCSFGNELSCSSVSNSDHLSTSAARASFRNRGNLSHVHHHWTQKDFWWYQCL